MDNEILIPTTFIRHRRQLRAFLLDDEPWFCVRDLGRLINRPLDERLHNSLDSDQLQSCWVRDSCGDYEKALLVSESGAYAALIFHFHPENRSIRHWLNRQVVPALRSAEHPALRPRERQLSWADQHLGVLEWHGRLWVPFDDLPAIGRLEYPEVPGSV
ncbi:Bro-N domain-containing protein [Pseudomonas sp.]|uniref:BRO-N domain-containing protein n=1 Tax=Pseudomonas sp. TaxID=306 RepID=UPI002911E34F|nr:Bro-N domain-containing protein [Pseudomonas sp.]MDU4254373.1 Bro-N domain-containing protein [Pseudomonas sp.]